MLAKAWQEENGADLGEGAEDADQNERPRRAAVELGHGADEDHGADEIAAPGDCFELHEPLPCRSSASSRRAALSSPGTRPTSPIATKTATIAVASTPRPPTAAATARTLPPCAVSTANR